MSQALGNGAKSAPENSLSRIIAQVDAATAAHTDLIDTAGSQAGESPDGATSATDEAAQTATAGAPKFVLRDGDAEREWTREELEALIASSKAASPAGPEPDLLAEGIRKLAPAQKAWLEEQLRGAQAAREESDEGVDLDPILGGKNTQEARASRALAERLEALEKTVAPLKQLATLDLQNRRMESYSEEVQRHMQGHRVFRDSPVLAEMAHDAAMQIVAADPKQVPNLKAIMAKFAGDYQKGIAQATAPEERADSARAEPRRFVPKQPPTGEQFRSGAIAKTLLHGLNGR